MFEGIYRLKFDPSNNCINSMVSKDGEEVELTKIVNTKNHVDSWLSDLEEEMTDTMKHYFF